MQHMRHLPDADFALIRERPEHNRGLAATRIVIDKFKAKMTMPTLIRKLQSYGKPWRRKGNSAWTRSQAR